MIYCKWSLVLDCVSLTNKTILLSSIYFYSRQSEHGQSVAGTMAWVCNNSLSSSVVRIYAKSHTSDINCNTVVSVRSYMDVDFLSQVFFSVTLLTYRHTHKQTHTHLLKQNLHTVCQPTLTLSVPFKC